MTDVPAIVPAITSEFFETSPDIAAFAKAFPKAQKAMGDVLKRATNPAFRTKYADLSAVVEAVIPPLNDNGFSVLQPPSGLRDGQVQVMTILLHESGQWMRCTLALTPSKADPQGVGSAITYARRYGLQAMSGVAPEDDDGNAASAGASASSEPQRKPESAALVGAAKAAIDITTTEAEAEGWRRANAPFLKQMEETNVAAYNDIAKHYKGHVKALKQPAAKPLNGSGEFGDPDHMPPF